jgi:murein DD-endopeptidase MepM/ murein hydrolase activator NlpD
MISHHAARVAWLATVAVLVFTGAQAAAEPGAPPSVTSARTHVIGRGDTLGAIARRYSVSVAALVAANRLPSEQVTLRIGRRLTIPPASASSRAEATTSSRSLPRVTTARAAAAIPPARPRIPTRGPRGLELAVPDFVEVAPPFGWPVEGFVSSTYGRRRSGWHRGIDIKASRGSVIFAAAGGVVVASGIEPRYGRVVKLEHDDGYMTVYAHNEENLVQPGMRVDAGDPIATIGRTGSATAHHLHFEIRRNGSVYNPLYLLPLPPRVGQVEESAVSEEDHE